VRVSDCSGVKPRAEERGVGDVLGRAPVDEVHRPAAWRVVEVLHRDYRRDGLRLSELCGGDPAEPRGGGSGPLCRSSASALNFSAMRHDEGPSTSRSAG